MNDHHWQPNEAKPGEMYTPEGQIEAAAPSLVTALF
jgi:hypothetical protein